MSFLPESERLYDQAETAQANGHEVILHLPMEPFDSHQPMEEMSLMTTMHADEVDHHVKWALGRYYGFVGLNNHMGSRFTSDPEAMTALMASISGYHGVYFLDSVTSSQSIAAQYAADWGVPSASRDIFLDHAGDHKTVEQRLDDALRQANREVVAIAIGHPHRRTVDAVRDWLARNEKNIQLVPVSQVIELRQDCYNDMQFRASNR